MPILNDISPMPWGIYKGLAMANVPGGYLLNLYEQNKVCADVRAYIKDNIEVLLKESKNNSKTTRYEKNSNNR